MKMRHKKMASADVRSRGRRLGREFAEYLESGIMPDTPDIDLCLIRSIYRWERNFKGVLK